MGVIYKTTNLINNKIYIGRDKHNDPKYYGSGTLLKRAIKKYGKENFIKEIICEETNLILLNELEVYWIETLKSTNPLIGYNLQKGGQGGDWGSLTEEQKTHIKKRVSESNKNRKLSKVTLEKKSKSMIGKNIGKRSDETKLKISANRIGKGIGNVPSNKGKKTSIETIQKLKEACSGDKNGMYGKKHTKESKLKMSLSAKERSSTSKGIFSKTYIFLKNNIKIIEIDGQSNAIIFCKENKLPYSILIKKLLPWNEYKILTINKK